jgi:hypothetical protein
LPQLKLAPFAHKPRIAPPSEDGFGTGSLPSRISHAPLRRLTTAPALLTEIRILAPLTRRFMLISVAVPEAIPDRTASSPSALASALAYALKKSSCLSSD